MEKSQRDKILEAFTINHGILTPGDIMRLGIAQYNARIKELRESGYNIEREYLGTFDGVKHTRFILINGPAEAKEPVAYSGAHATARKIRLEKEAANPQTSLLL